MTFAAVKSQTRRVRLSLSRSVVLSDHPLQIGARHWQLHASIHSSTHKGIQSRPERTTQSSTDLEAMAAAASSLLTLPLQLLRYGTPSSSRVGLRAHHPPSPPSVRLRAARGPRPIAAAAASYHDDASGCGAGDDDGIAAATSVALLHQVDEDAAAAAGLRAARPVGCAPQPPKGRAGKPKEGGGGKVHAAPTSSAAKRTPRAPAPAGLPKEGSGGQGGKVH